MPTFDAAASSSAVGASSLTFAHSIGSGSNRALYVGASTGGFAIAISSVTWNGNALTELYDDAASPTFYHIALARLKEADGISTTSANVVITPGGSSDISGASISLLDVNQTTPNGAVDSENLDTGVTQNSIASAIGDLVVEFSSMADPVSATTSNSERVDTYNATSNILMLAQTAAGAATVAVDWTPSTGPAAYRSVAVSVAPASAALIAVAWMTA